MKDLLGVVGIGVIVLSGWVGIYFAEKFLDRSQSQKISCESPRDWHYYSSRYLRNNH